MPLTLQSFNFAIICGENELETYDVKKEGPNSTTAFVASEAGKQFRVAFTNNLLDFDLLFVLHIDGERISSSVLQVGGKGEIRGIRNSATTRLPFKFQELELVDPDLEHAPVGPEMGTIELQAFRCQALGYKPYQPSYNVSLHEGRVSERSKKAGWHHVSTADEVPVKRGSSVVDFRRIDPINVPYESIMVFYRPRELLMAQGVIIGHDVGTETGGGSEVNDRKRVREYGSPGPSKRRTASTIKKEEISDARAQRIQALQAELNSLTGESGSSVKHERAPSPIVVGQAAGEVVDLTLED